MAAMRGTEREYRTGFTYGGNCPELLLGVIELKAWTEELQGIMNNLTEGTKVTLKWNLKRDSCSLTLRVYVGKEYAESRFIGPNPENVVEQAVEDANGSL